MLTKKFNPVPVRFFLHYWWVVLVIALSYGCYLHGMYKKQSEEKRLFEIIASLENEKIAATIKSEDLKLKMRSLSDPETIQLILMKCLGVVPEGQTKVYFRE